jgi:hypothetical protein
MAATATVGSVWPSHRSPVELDDARQLLEGVVADVPDYTEAHVMLATCYYRLKRSEDAERHRAILSR